MTDNHLPLREYSRPVRDFSISDEPLPFKLGQDIFEAVPVVPPVLLDELTAALAQMGAEGRTNIELLNDFAAIFDVLLTEGTALRFRERLMSRTEPIDLNRQLVPIIQWLLEEYGMRPMEPSSD